jgi:hypothetical protein
MSTRFQPDDARITVDALQYLRRAEGVVLRQAVAELPDAAHPSVAQIASLRKRFPAPPLHAALTLAALQPKAAGPKGKWPQLAYVWATPEALEQATHALVARHKARQFAQVAPAHIFDLCAGIGGDSLALAEVAPVTAIELSAVRTACLAGNVADAVPPPRFPLDIRTGDIRESLATIPEDAWVHIDPARRSEGRRSARYQDLIPGPEWLEKLFARVRGGAIKLSPAVDFASLPRGHLELISHRGTVVQALLWLGPFPMDARSRTATVLSDTLPGWSFQAPPLVETLKPFSFFKIPLPDAPIHFYELDGAVTRAGLAHAFALKTRLIPVTVDGGYLVAEPGAPALDHPALAAFTVRTIVPFSVTRVAETLCRLESTSPGPVEVKCRGRLPGVDTDQLQKTWARTCPCAYTVLLFGHENDTLAVVATRVRA